MSSPHKRALLKEADHKLIILALIFLCLVTAEGVRGMEIWHTLASILGITEAAVWITAMEIIHPKVIEPHKGSVPSKVQIPAYYV
jgi:hypothetical protein